MAGNGNKQNEKTYKLLEHYNKKKGRGEQHSCAGREGPQGHASGAV